MADESSSRSSTDYSEKVALALVQMKCGPNRQDNVELALARIADAAACGANIVCLPELFATQYPCQQEDHRQFDQAESIPGPTSDALADAAAEHGVVVIGSLFERRDVLICPPDHPLGGRKWVRLKDLAEVPLLALERGSTSRQLMDDAFRQAGLAPRVAMNLGGIEVIKRFVEIGLGVALVPQVTVGEEARQGRLAAVGVRGLGSRAIGLVEHRGRRRSRPAEVFLEMLRSFVASNYARKII